jgi:mannose-1-phosphate guanylyltransferase
LKSILFCGGEGTRLRPLTYYFQKTMIPIGSNQKPLLEYVVLLLRRHGFTDILLLVNYKAEQIINYFGDGSRFGVKLSYLQDDPGLKGSGGAIVNALRKRAIGESDDFLVYYGDILTNMDISDLMKRHQKRKVAATIALSKGFSVPVGVAEVSTDGMVTRFTEKPNLDKPVSIGIMALNGITLKYLTEISTHRNEIDLMGHLIPELIACNEPVQAYLMNNFWYDVGSTEKYEKLSNVSVERNLGYLFK